MELAGTGTKTGVLPDLPQFDVLLRSCGLEHSEVTRFVKTGTLADLGSTPRVPMMLRHREALGEGGTDYAGATSTIGRCVGDVHYDDPYVYYASAGVTPANLATAAPKIWGQATSLIDGASSVSAAYAVCGTDFTSVSGTVPTPNGHAWFPADGTKLGGAGTVTATNGSSCTIVLGLSDAGQTITAAGCRGTVEFNFISGDRCIMQFTMTGKLRSYDNTASAPTPGPITQALPPTIVGINAGIQSSSYGITHGDAVFNTMSLNLGNDVTLRENVNDAVGYEASYITGRSCTFTINPDASAHGISPLGPYDWWNTLLSGDLTRLRFVISDDSAGDDDANSFTFKFPAIQFDQVGDGDRDTVMAYDLAAQATGGDNGSSVQEAMSALVATTDSTILNKRLGTNNEFVLYLT
mgnify:FL=1